MANLKPKDRVPISGISCKVIRNDHTNRALVVHETDEYGSHLYPVLDRDVECDSCLSYYEDLDLKTADNARHKFKVRPGVGSSVGTAKSTTVEDPESLDHSIGPQIGDIGLSVGTSEAGQLEQTHSAPYLVPIASASKKLPKSTHTRSANVQSVISAEDYAALVTRIAELEQENGQLKTNAVVLRMEESRNEEMINQFVGTMAKLVQNFKYNSDQQRAQTDRLEDLGLQFVNQGHKLARCKLQIMQENKNELQRMGESLQSTITSQVNGAESGSHELLSTARNTLHKQISGITPMTSPAHFSPSPKVQSTSTKRSLGPSMNESTEQPKAKKLNLGAPVDPEFTSSTISKILGRHGFKQTETLEADEVEEVDQRDGEAQSAGSSTVQKTPVHPKPTMPTTTRPVKKNTQSLTKLRPKSYTASPGLTEQQSDAVPINPKLPLRSQTLAAKLTGYMKEIDKGSPNGRNLFCIQPFNFHGDPEFKDDRFKKEYLPLCLAALNLEPDSASNEVVAAHFHFEGVDLNLYSALSAEYQEKELTSVTIGLLTKILTRAPVLGNGMLRILNPRIGRGSLAQGTSVRHLKEAIVHSPGDPRLRGRNRRSRRLDE